MAGAKRRSRRVSRHVATAIKLPPEERDPITVDIAARRALRKEITAAVNARRNHIRMLVVSAEVAGAPITDLRFIQEKLKVDLGTEVSINTIGSDLDYLNIFTVRPEDAGGRPVGSPFLHAFSPSLDQETFRAWTQDTIAIETDARLAAHLIHAFPFQDKVILEVEDHTAHMVKHVLAMNMWPDMIAMVADHSSIIIFTPGEQHAIDLHHRIIRAHDQTPYFRIVQSPKVLEKQDYRRYYRAIEGEAGAWEAIRDSRNAEEDGEDDGEEEGGDDGEEVEGEG